MRIGLSLVAAAVLLTGCAPTPTTTAQSPSEQAKMVCAQEAQNDIEIRLGLVTTGPVTPTWADGVYSCRYTYANGSFMLSVKDLPDMNTTAAYFDSQARKYPKHTTVPALGDGSFTVPDGSVFVRKDAKVLQVDATGLPDQFGVPPVPRAQAARGIAIVIMGCWSGG
jgi:hypothetical protein